jgi:hypothetical protein
MQRIAILAFMLAAVIMIARWFGDSTVHTAKLSKADRTATIEQVR